MILKLGFSLSYRFESLTDDFKWVLSGVYDPHTNHERTVLWHELAGIRGLWSDMGFDIWVIGGVLNVCRFGSERLNCNRRSCAMMEISNTILDLDLIDPPLQGTQYTWSRGEEFLQASRIDRFLFSPEWSEMFNSIKQYALPGVFS